MIKNGRHKIIRDIIENNNIETQFQLTDELKKHGFNVTQATVSRDIKEMGLIKIAYGENAFRYSFPVGMMAGNVYERAKRMFRDNIQKIEGSENIIVVKTLPGVAQAVASCIDGLGWKELLGCVAGDDTIIIAIRDRDSLNELCRRLQELCI